MRSVSLHCTFIRHCTIIFRHLGPSPSSSSSLVGLAYLTSHISCLRISPAWVLHHTSSMLRRSPTGVPMNEMIPHDKLNCLSFVARLYTTSNNTLTSQSKEYSYNRSSIVYRHLPYYALHISQPTGVSALPRHPHRLALSLLPSAEQIIIKTPSRTRSSPPPP